MLPRTPSKKVNNLQNRSKYLQVLYLIRNLRYLINKNIKYIKNFYNLTIKKKTQFKTGKGLDKIFL